jgi:hypothetical protein
MTQGPGGQPPQYHGYGQPAGYAPQQGYGYGAPPPGPPPPAGPSGHAIASLILGVLSWIMCMIIPIVGMALSITGLVLAKQDLKKIERGESPEAGKTLSQIGYWVSLSNVIVSGIACLLGIAYLLFVFVFAAAGSAGAY